MADQLPQSATRESRENVDVHEFPGSIVLHNKQVIEYFSDYRTNVWTLFEMTLMESNKCSFVGEFDVGTFQWIAVATSGYQGLPLLHLWIKM